MVTEFGMSEELGPLRFGQPQGEVFLGRDLNNTQDYSDEVAARIDAEVRRLVEDAHRVAREILEANREVLEELVAELVADETIETERVQQLFAGVQPFTGRGLGRVGHAAASEKPSPTRRSPS
jgi:cell division protease FtsH